MKAITIILKAFGYPVLVCELEAEAVTYTIAVIEDFASLNSETMLHSPCDRNTSGAAGLVYETRLCVWLCNGLCHAGQSHHGLAF